MFDLGIVRTVQTGGIIGHKGHGNYLHVLYFCFVMQFLEKNLYTSHNLESMYSMYYVLYSAFTFYNSIYYRTINVL